MVATSIDTVPNEVLRGILARVRNAARLAEFVLCLRVCRRWNETGAPLAWRILVLDKEKMDRLVMSALQYSHPFHFVSSLQISVGAPCPSKCHCDCHEDEDYWPEGGGNHQRRCNDDDSEI